MRICVKHFLRTQNECQIKLKILGNILIRIIQIERMSGHCAAFSVIIEEREVLLPYAKTSHNDTSTYIIWKGGCKCNE